jgi:TrmH family RNA methyltransferase
VLALDGIQEPGNAGAIVRTAEAFGGSGILFLKGAVSPYNPKAIRSSAGSLFRMPLVAGIEEDIAVAAMAQRKIQLFAAMPHAEHTLLDADLRHPCAFVIGSEGRGVSRRMQAAAQPVRISTTRVESLNAGVAAAILVYEAWRQRRTGT